MEFEKFLKIRDIDGSLGPLYEGLEPGGATAKWSGNVNWPGGTVDTRFVQLGWQDIIKPDFERSWLRRMVDAIWSFYLYARAGGYSSIIKSNWAHALFILYPAVGFLFFCILSLVPPILIAPAILESVGEAYPAVEAKSRISWIAAFAMSGLWFGAVYSLTRLLEARTYFWYLVNSWHFMARLSNNAHPAISKRIEEFADFIVGLEEQADDEEEILFVSHSVGTFVAIYILAAVLRRKPDIGKRRGGFAFVTLGPAFDCLGGFGAERGFGEAMATVVQAGVDWTDIYGPHDIVCGGRTAPVARYASSVLAGGIMPEPRRFSVCIPDRMSDEKFRRLRFRFFQLHFCYFFASMRRGLFDFYRLTLGPKRATTQLEAWAESRD